MKNPPPTKDLAIEITCPECKAKVMVDAKEAERSMKARCPKGHDIPLVQAM
jgi:hypothetical protein